MTHTLPLPPLLPGEHIVHTSLSALIPSDHALDPDAVMAHLCGVTLPAMIGSTGPPSASGVSLQNVGGGQGLFNALFGRDALIVARLAGGRYPALIRSTILRLAALQGLTTHAAREEEPGRIVHEYRVSTDPIAVCITADRGWGWPYYGSVDATPMFVTLAAEEVAANPEFAQVEVVGLDGQPRLVIDTIAAATSWIIRRMDESPSGLVESTSAIPCGIANQVWKDSPDSYFHADGSLATPGTVASVEVVGLCYDALCAAFRLAPHFPDAAWPDVSLSDRSYDLRSALTRFIAEDAQGKFVSLALDRDGSGNERRCEVRSSNAGWLLASHILDGTIIAKIVVDQILDSGMHCTAGLRTVHSNSARFRPGSYHNGSSWPMDTIICAQGLRRHGYAQQADELERRVTNSCTHSHMFPEFFRGDNTLPATISQWVVDVDCPVLGRINRVEQPPQELQAWTVAAVIAAEENQ